MMFGGQTNEADSIEIMHKALDQGINFFDTADIYNAGESEVVVGKAIANRRDQVVVATKGRGPMGEGPNDKGASRVHLMNAVDDSLRDWVPITSTFIISTHPITIHRSMKVYEHSMTWFVRAKCVTSHVQISGHGDFVKALWTSDKLHLHAFSCLQPLYNIVNRDIEVEVLPLCQEHGLGSSATAR